MCVSQSSSNESFSSRGFVAFVKVGTLRASLQALFVTDEVRKLAGREQVEVDVTIHEEEYEKARNELSTFKEKGYKSTLKFIQAT